MNKFQIKKEKLPPLTLEDILDCGWKEKKMNHVKEYVFEKGNYWLICNFNDPEMAIIRIIPIDPTLITWMHDPENFRMIFRCPSKEYFQMITSTL